MHRDLWWYQACLFGTGSIRQPWSVMLGRLRRPTAVVFVPKNFGMIDAYVRLVPELAEKSAGRAADDLVFRRESVFRDYRMSEFHVSIFERYTNVHRLFTGTGRFARARSYGDLLRLVLLILWRRVTCSSVRMIHSYGRFEGSTGLLDRIFGLLRPLGVQ